MEQTLSELKARHRSELQIYFRERDQRSVVLEKEQQELMDDINYSTPDSATVLAKLLQDQKELYAEKEQNEMHMILNFHQHEVDSFEKEHKRQGILEQFQTYRSQKGNDNGR